MSEAAKIFIRNLFQWIFPELIACGALYTVQRVPKSGVVLPWKKPSVSWRSWDAHGSGWPTAKNSQTNTKWGLFKTVMQFSLYWKSSSRWGICCFSPVEAYSTRKVGWNQHWMLHLVVRLVLQLAQWEPHTNRVWNHVSRLLIRPSTTELSCALSWCMNYILGWYGCSGNNFLCSSAVEGKR